MTREELFHLAAECSRETADANKEMIGRRVKDAFNAETGGQLSAHEAVARGTALALGLAPDLAAATTMRLLLRLGLVQAED